MSVIFCSSWSNSTNLKILDYCGEGQGFFSTTEHGEDVIRKQSKVMENMDWKELEANSLPVFPTYDNLVTTLIWGKKLSN